MSFAERFYEEGWLQVDRVFSPALIDDVRSEFELQFGALTALQGKHRQHLTVGPDRLMLPVALRGPFLDPAFYAHPVLLRILRQLLGEDFLIDSLACVVALPGAAEQSLHRDHGDLFCEEPGLSGQAPPYAVTMVIPLIDLTLDTGTTQLFPGSQRDGRTGKAATPYLPQGSCVLMDYRIMHHGTANNSRAQRPVLYIVFSRPWFTDIRNFRRQPRINIDREGLRKVPSEHWPLFRRLATKGGFDLSEKELFPGNRAVANGCCDS